MMIPKAYVNYTVKLKSQNGFIKAGGFISYDHVIPTDRLIAIIKSVESRRNSWISYACFNIKRVLVNEPHLWVEGSDNEIFTNAENRIFLRKDDEFIQFNGKV